MGSDEDVDVHTHTNVCVLEMDFAIANRRPKSAADGDGDVNGSENARARQFSIAPDKFSMHQANLTRSPSRDGYHYSQHNPYETDATHPHTSPRRNW